jgi:hypothetical protein
MKKLALIASLVCSTLGAQSSFRIFDDQMNDVTSGVMYIADTNAAQILCNLTVENIDSVSRNVTAGRLVLTSPVTASNAMIWGATQYPPNADSSTVSEIMAPGGMQSFQGLYFPNGNGGLATINYCFWDRYDMNNNACVTVTFDNFFSSGGTPIAPSRPAITYGPNPAPYVIGVGWYNYFYESVNLYSSNGTLIDSRDVRGEASCEFEISHLPPGIYMINCVGVNEETYNARFIH